MSSNHDSQTPSRTVWKGQLSLGLLALPVRFVTAARGVTLEFKQLHRADHSRLKQVWYCEQENKAIAKEEIVKGYEHEPGKYVVISPEDLKRAAPETSRTMEVLQFVFLADVDPVYFDQSYYLEPGEGGEGPYALLYKVMLKTRCCALIKLAMHNREHVAILRPGPRGIVLQTLFYHDEIRAMAEFRTDISQVKKSELELAEELVASLVGKFEPEKYEDEFRKNMLAVIAAKVSGGEVEAAGAPAPAKPMLDVMEALRRSISAAK